MIDDAKIACIGRALAEALGKRLIVQQLSRHIRRRRDIL
jgi:uroporphyrinogen-III synthase